MDKNSIFWQFQEGKLPAPPAAITLGIKIVAADGEAGTIEVEFDGKKEFTNPIGNIQGGFLAAMLDDTLGPALTATLAAGEFAPTINLNVQFLSAAKPGLIKGRGRVVKRGKEICYMSGELLQDGKVVATATAAAIIRKI